jgi:hypothetical protein
MFGKMFKGLLEPFTINYNQEPNKGHEEIRYYYGDKRPNAIYSAGDTDIPLESPTTTYMGTDINGSVKLWDNTVIPKINRKEATLKDKFLLPNNSLSNNILTQRQSECESLASGEADQFAHLSNLAKNVNERSRLRCGWVYNNANPEQGRGAYGTINGPFETSASGTWTWNLEAAKKKYHASICSQVKSCEDLSDPKYRGRCGFCKTTTKGIPISGSVAAYPYDPTLACSANSIVLSSDKCPVAAPPPPRDSPAYASYVANRQVCDPSENGSLSRDCLISKAEQVCSDKGTLVAALKSGGDTNYLDTLTQASSYGIYQQRATNGMNETALKTGKLTVGDALREFRSVADNAASAANAGLKVAAKDLCFTKGLMDEYDFCTEIQPSQAGPFALNCLQTAFKRAGGQSTGSMYPSATNIDSWNSYNKWKDVTDAISALATSTRSSDRREQEEAMAEFYGISLDDKKGTALGDINNVEVFWFTRDTNITSADSTYNTTFLGRRIRSQIPSLQTTNNIPGTISSGASFVFFTRYRAPAQMQIKLKVTADSGFILLKDAPMKNVYTGTGTKTGTEFSAYQLPNINVGNPLDNSSSPWTLTTNNILTGYYVGGGNNFSMQYSASTSVNVPSECGCYGYSIPQIVNSFRAYNKADCDAVGGDYVNGDWCNKRGNSNQAESWSKMCQPLNLIPSLGSGNSCIITPNVFSRESLFLLQDPYAPMISFETRQNFANYNCDFPFCDKRLGSHKMKWATYGATGATPDFIGTSRDKNKYTLRKSFMAFRTGSSIWSRFLIKIYSFMTMTYMVRFTTLPGNGIRTRPFILWASDPNIDYPTIFVTGIGGNKATVNVGGLMNPTGGTNAYGVTTPSLTTNGPTIGINQTYIITLKAIRGTENDIKTLRSLKVGAATVSELQRDPSKLKETSELSWANSRHLDSPDNNSSLFFLINTDAGAVQYDLFSIQMYDYILAGENLRTAAYDSWPQAPTNVYT